MERSIQLGTIFFFDTDNESQLTFVLSLLKHYNEYNCTSIIGYYKEDNVSDATKATLQNRLDDDERLADIKVFYKKHGENGIDDVINDLCLRIYEKFWYYIKNYRQSQIEIKMREGGHASSSSYCCQ